MTHPAAKGLNDGGHPHGPGQGHQGPALVDLPRVRCRLMSTIRWPTDLSATGPGHSARRRRSRLLTRSRTRPWLLVGQAAVEEAKRLLYVSMTRARDLLVLARSSRRPSGEWLDSLGAPWLLPAEGCDAVELPNGERISADHWMLEPLEEPGNGESSGGTFPVH